MPPPFLPSHPASIAAAAAALPWRQETPRAMAATWGRAWWPSLKPSETNRPPPPKDVGGTFDTTGHSRLKLCDSISRLVCDGSNLTDSTKSQRCSELHLSDLVISEAIGEPSVAQQWHCHLPACSTNSMTRWIRMRARTVNASWVSGAQMDQSRSEDMYNSNAIKTFVL